MIVGRNAASALPSRNSSRRTGVVSTGSSVPWSRSPTTEYAATTAGTSAGMSSRYIRARPTTTSSLDAGTEEASLKMSKIGSATNSSGMNPMLATTKRLRR